MRGRLLVSVVAILLVLGCKRPVPPPPPPTAAPGVPGGKPPILAEVAEPATLAGSMFAPACDVPFGSIGGVRNIDNVCGQDGTGSEKSKLQNAAKNNFCAPGPAIDINRQTLERLQQKVDALQNFPWGTPTNIQGSADRHWPRA